MRDKEIRVVLHKKLLNKQHNNPSTLVLEELGLQHGAARIDIAVLSNTFCGFEIKSEADTLNRLPGQAAIYNMILDKITLVVGDRHYSKAQGVVPEWWGLIVVTTGQRGALHLQLERKPVQNETIDPYALAQLLWRPEAKLIAARAGADQQILRKPRRYLYQFLADSIELPKLRSCVTQTLKSREGWRHP